MTENLPARLQTGGGAVTAIIPRDLSQIMQLASIIAASGMAPKAYQKNADARQGYDEAKIVVGILHGMEVGLTPLASLQSIAVINGAPAIWGDGLIALIRASGLLEDISETIEGESLGRTATCVMKRKGQATPIIRTFSMHDAKKAGLIGKQGPWTNYPDRMCQLRARGFCGRDGFADVLRGLRMVEEVQDMGPSVHVESTPIDAPPPPTREQFKAVAGTAVVTDVDAETGEDLSGHRDWINPKKANNAWAWATFIPAIKLAIGMAESRDHVEEILRVNDAALDALTNSGETGGKAVDAINASAALRIAALEPAGMIGDADDEIPEGEAPKDWPGIAQSMIDKLDDVPSQKALDVILATPRFADLAEMKTAAPQQYEAVAELIADLRPRLPVNGKAA